MDFLFHEMPVTTLVDHSLARSDDHHFTIDRPAAASNTSAPSGVTTAIVIVLQVDDIAGQMRQCNGIGTDKTGSITNPDRQWRRISSNDHHVRLIDMHCRERECALDLRQNMRTGFPCIHSHIETGKKQVRQYLRVGFAGEFMSLVFEFGTKLRMVFNNAIVDDRHFLVGNMRMGISFGHAPMSCPACVTNTRNVPQAAFHEVPPITRPTCRQHASC